MLEGRGGLRFTPLWLGVLWCKNFFLINMQKNTSFTCKRIFLRKNVGPHRENTWDREKLTLTKPKKTGSISKSPCSHPSGASIVLMIFFDKNDIKKKISVEKYAFFYFHTVKKCEIRYKRRICYHIFALLYKGPVRYK